MIPMKMKLFYAVLTAFFTLWSGAASGFEMTLAHVNDTHSHLAPIPVTLKIDGVKTVVELGGFARLKTVIDRMRADDPHMLLLHAGDAVQGTLYFSLFNGSVEFDFLNLLNVDAFTFGNHEFDRGTGPIPGWIKRSHFPWLSANIDFSAEPAIAKLVRPYLIKEINGEKVGVIGATTETTPLITISVGKAVFNDAAQSVRRQVEALNALGINKIILLSHLGYIQDKLLASSVAGLDIVVGGHSHSLLGEKDELSAIGLIPEGPYPTEVKTPDGKRALVLQAWRWGHALGNVKVNFTPDGEITGFSGKTVIPVGDAFFRNGVAVKPGDDGYQGIIDALNKTKTAVATREDPFVAGALKPYTDRLQGFRRDVAAVAVDDIPIGVNRGPGPLAADSMLSALPEAQLAIINFGGVRRGFKAGAISVGDILEVMPFSNTLVLVDLTGAELKQAFEDAFDYLAQRYGANSRAMPYLGNAAMTVHLAAAKGVRVTALAVKDKEGAYQPVQPAKIYRTVVNAFVAGGGDGFAVIKNAAGFRSDTGIIDSDALRDYLKKLGKIHNPAERRIVFLP